MRSRINMQNKLRLFSRRLPKSAAFQVRAWVAGCASDADTVEVETFAKTDRTNHGRFGDAPWRVAVHWFFGV
jgi:hypothetical protein